MYIGLLSAMLSMILSRSNGFRSIRGISAFSSNSYAFHHAGLTSITSAKFRYLSGNGSDSRGYIGTPQDDREMKQRIDDAKGWSSYKLSDEEAAHINMNLGIEKEIWQAGEQGNKLTRKERNKDTSPLGKIKGLQLDKESPKIIRGFLQQNPVLCSGCGTPFQSKSPDNPGYLPKEIFVEHKKRAELTRAIQDAVKLLELASLELDSDLAVELLRSGDVPDVVIEGVKELARKTKLAATEEEMSRNAGNRSNPPQMDEFVGKTRIRKVKFNEETSTYEAYVPHPQEGVDESLLQPMSALEIEAYNNRYAKFNKNKNKAKKAEQAGVVIADHSEAALSDDTGIVAGDGRTDSNAMHTDSATKPNLDIIFNAHAKEVERVSDPDKLCICQRCFRLQNYGQVDESLRPGWSNNELLTPERFEKLLSGIKNTPSVVLCLVDIFDLRGSILRNLKEIVGNNPLVIAANKVDLLPADVSMQRISNWILTEVRDICGYHSAWRDDGMEERRGCGGADDRPLALRALDDDYDDDDADAEGSSLRQVGKGAGARVGAESDEWRESAKARKARKLERNANTLRNSDVHLVSCQTGAGMDKLLASIMGKAATNGNKIHVMGAANVGKSSFINRLLESAHKSKTNKKSKKSIPSKEKSVAKATVSNLPGTTLDFLKIQLPNGIVMIDTPGLLQKGQLTSKLNASELKQVIPTKVIKPVTLRMEEGRCMLLGGLARVELLEGRPCFFTFFVSDQLKLHPTSAVKADDVIQRHVGDLLAPPATLERYKEIGPFVSQDVVISGESWKKSESDIVIAGLGWVSVTGPGTFTVRITTPEDTLVGLRTALLPYEAPLTTVKFSGGRLIRKGAVKRVVRTERPAKSATLSFRSGGSSSRGGFVRRGVIGGGSGKEGGEVSRRRSEGDFSGRSSGNQQQYRDNGTRGSARDSDRGSERRGVFNRNIESRWQSSD